MDEGDEGGGQAADDIEDRPVARRFLTHVMGESLHLTVQGCNWKRGLLKSKALDDLFNLHGDGASLSSIAALLPGEPNETLGARQELTTSARLN
ncbi:MAG TPA: hypothetical protein VN829_06210 [Dongiaceae bacterium]|nr:hypothetical protein [Dongiaceae bacterium]